MSLWYFYKRYWREVALSLLCLGFVGVHIWGANLAGLYDHESVKNPDLMFMNTEFMNTDIDPIVDYINTIEPKRIALVELNAQLFEQIKVQ